MLLKLSRKFRFGIKKHLEASCYRSSARRCGFGTEHAFISINAKTISTECWEAVRFPLFLPFFLFLALSLSLSMSLYISLPPFVANHLQTLIYALKKVCKKLRIKIVNIMLMTEQCTTLSMFSKHFKLILRVLFVCKHFHSGKSESGRKGKKSDKPVIYV